MEVVPPPELVANQDPTIADNKDAATTESKRVHVKVQSTPFKVVIAGVNGLENHITEAGNPSTAVSKTVRECLSDIPLKTKVRVWVQSKQKIYEHEIIRDYDNAKRKGFTNNRLRAYKHIDHVGDIPIFLTSDIMACPIKFGPVKSIPFDNIPETVHIQ